jgi:hypothetical protein
LTPAAAILLTLSCAEDASWLPVNTTLMLTFERSKASIGSQYPVNPSGETKPTSLPSRSFSEWISESTGTTIWELMPAPAGRAMTFQPRRSRSGVKK